VGTGVGKSSTIQPKNNIRIENPIAGETGEKNSATSEFAEFTLIQKYIQLLFIEQIWQNKKFDKNCWRQQHLTVINLLI
jgi:hypothetical protein